MPFLIIFFLLTMAELYVFMLVGEEIGILTTILLCFLTAMIGGFLVRLQGFETLMKAQSSIRTGKMPLNEIFDGFCIVIAGALLLTPGFLTDFTGFLLLIPPFRAFLKIYLTNNTKFSAKTAPFKQSTRQEGVIEGEYERVEKDKPPLEQSNKDI